MSRAAVLLFAFFAVAAEAKVRSVDPSMRTVTFQAGTKAASYPLARLIVLPRPEGVPDFEPLETVDVDSDGKYFIVRRPAKLEARRKAMLAKLPPEKQAAVGRAARERQRVAAVGKAALSPAKMRVGEVGTLPQRCRVVQVVDGKNVRLEYGFEVLRTDFWVEGVDTKNLSEGREAMLPGVFEVAGTKRYDSNAGARQVLLVKPYEGKSLASAPDLAELDRFEQSVKDRLASDLAEQRKALDRGAGDKATAESPASERDEAAARLRLRLAKDLKAGGKLTQAEKALEKLVKDYPKTKAAEEARQLLKP